MIGIIRIGRSSYKGDRESGTDVLYRGGMSPDPLVESSFRAEEWAWKHYRDESGYDYWPCATLNRAGIKRGRKYSIHVSNRPHRGWKRLTTQRFGRSKTTHLLDDKGRLFVLPCMGFLEWLIGINWQRGRKYHLYIRIFDEGALHVTESYSPNRAG